MRPHEAESRILIIDSYDSFTFNLAALVKKAIPSSIIYIIKNDEISSAELLEYLPFFDAIIVGPGPGSPLVSTDVGVIRDLWHIAEESLLPIFGVCLGLQSLAVEHGAALGRLPVVKHGQVSKLLHGQDALYAGIPSYASVVRYHSLCVHLKASGKLEALAWADDGKENGRVVMALKHTSKPFWAVQYHPESVCTDASGIRLIQNFWRLAHDWSAKRQRSSRYDQGALVYFLGKTWPASPSFVNPGESDPVLLVQSEAIALQGLTVPKICEVLGIYKANTDFVLLDSVAPPGKYAIIGCIHSRTLRIQFTLEENVVTILQEGTAVAKHVLGSMGLWTWLSIFMKSKKAAGGDSDIPFWGGLVGYLNYRLGVDNLRCNVGPQRSMAQKFPDANLFFIERSVIIDTRKQQILVQSILPADKPWIVQMISMLSRSASMAQDRTPSRPSSSIIANVVYPDKARYIERIKQAQRYLFSGDSYELCLTAQTRIQVAKTPEPASQRSWELYKKLRTSNPAPYAAYLRFGSTTVISSSPERFLSYSRPPNQLLQLRPIKGTVRKGGTMTRQHAAEILSSPKEIGENLMIVDLIRHDLHGAVGAGVSVTKFCGIEEYETVWQLVSVIEGRNDNTHDGCEQESHYDNQLGWTVLQQSLPPGSMTGAPKKRSVEILDDLEDEDRGIYSGVLGYWCVGGSGDWSVVIRSCFKFDEEHIGQSTGSEDRRSDHDTWFVGAGGAITALSDPESEWEEMIVKLQSVLRAFRTM